MNRAPDLSLNNYELNAANIRLHATWPGVKGVVFQTQAYWDYTMTWTDPNCMHERVPPRECSAN